MSKNVHNYVENLKEKLIQMNVIKYEYPKWQKFHKYVEEIVKICQRYVKNVRNMPKTYTI